MWGFHKVSAPWHKAWLCCGQCSPTVCILQFQIMSSILSQCGWRRGTGACKRLSDAFEFSFTSSWLFCHSNFHIEVLPLPRKRSQGQAFCGCSHLAVSPTLCRAMLIAAAVPVAMSSLSTGMSASRQQCLQPWLPLAQACRHGCVRQYIMPWCFEFDQYVGLSEVPAQSVQVAH